MKPLVALISLASALCAQASWSQLYPPTIPSARASASIACFEPTGDVVMLFGIANGYPAAQSWKLQGATWSPFVAPPGTGYGRGLVYDASRQRLVLFGGHAPTPSNDTWEFDGSAWTNPNPATRPAARSRFAMAFDRARGVTVVYGGIGATGSFLDDLWEWNGATWTQRATSTPLTARSHAMAAFDPVNGNVLVHGGLSPMPGGTMTHNDSWAWDGVAWMQHTPPVPLPYDVGGVLVSDIHRQRVVLCGGTIATGTTAEWDGSAWSFVVQPNPGPLVDAAATYDAALRRTVVFGGTCLGNLVNGTWVYETPLPADVSAFGIGCAGSAGTPLLANAPQVLPWLGGTFTDVVQPLPAGGLGAVFVSSFGTTLPVSLDGFGMPGCSLLVPTDVIELSAATGGTAAWSVGIPNVPSLAAASFRQQAFVLDPAANPLGLAASNGVLVTIGIR
jgi:hypothetical protein